MILPLTPPVKDAVGADIAAIPASSRPVRINQEKQNEHSKAGVAKLCHEERRFPWKHPYLKSTMLVANTPCVKSCVPSCSLSAGNTQSDSRRLGRGGGNQQHHHVLAVQVFRREVRNGSASEGLWP
jgi:hypothetical protein